MVISEKKKYCLIHIPKTGGTSVQEALLAATPDGTKGHWAQRGIDNPTRHYSVPELQTGFARGKYADQRLISPKRPVAALRALYMCGKRWGRQLTGADPELDDYFIFTFVRNPWDRTVSLYSYLRDRCEEPSAPQDASEGMRGISSFEEFVDYLMTEPLWLRKRRACKPQVAFLKDNNGEEVTDFVGRFENLAEDFSRVCERIGVEARLPHVNSSRHQEYTEYYSAELAAKVGKFYESDVSRFGYEFPYSGTRSC